MQPTVMQAATPITAGTGTDGPLQTVRGFEKQFDAHRELIHIDTAVAVVPPDTIHHQLNPVPEVNAVPVPYPAYLPLAYPLPLGYANISPPTGAVHPSSQAGVSGSVTPSGVSSRKSKGKGKAASKVNTGGAQVPTAASVCKKDKGKSLAKASGGKKGQVLSVNPGDQSPAGLQFMEYPPPPPVLGARYESSPSMNGLPADPRRNSVSLPSMGSWAPPPMPSPHIQSHSFNAHMHPLPSSPGYGNAAPLQPPIVPSNRATGAGNPTMPFPSPPWAGDQLPRESSPVKQGKKRPRPADHSRRPSSEEEEAGLALAGLGMGLSAGEVRARRDSSGAATKKVKMEETNKGRKGGEKDMRKSCSECRRLKAKCDRQFPCSNCRRRGCALVCPDGDLSCMQGKRLVLASTEQLHDRIAQLETALFQAHSKVSAQSHPLLAPEYLDGGFASLDPLPLADQATRPLPTLSQSPLGQVADVDANRSPKDRDRSSASSFTLQTPKLGAERSNSLGRMAVESLLLSEDAAAPEGKREDEWVGENAAPAMIVGTVGNAPGDEAIQRHLVVERLREILLVLPPRAEARRRAENFWDTSTWYQNILRKDEFDAIYEPAVYAPTPANPLTPHKLACVLMVLVLDTYFDVSRPDEEDDPSVGEYWDGAQRCFDTRFGWAASVAGVQALALATLFVGFGWRGALASNFYWLRLMTSQAQQLGLHKEPHPSLPEDERDFRRRVFHEMWTLDCLISINHGQRTAIALENIEAAYPKEVPALLLAKYEYMRYVKSQVIEIGCRPDSNPASQDQLAQVRTTGELYDAAKTPELHCPVLSGEPLPPCTSDPTRLDNKALTRATTSMCHYKAMLFLYRPSLRRLIARIRSQPPEAVVLSEADRQTVSMTYMACRSVTACSAYVARTHPRIAARCWSTWVQTFSAAVSMAALAIWCSPHLEPGFIDLAYGELVTACEMIKENGSKRSLGVLSLLPILSTLVASRYPQVEGKPPSTAKISFEGEDMLFLLLGGQSDSHSTTKDQTKFPSERALSDRSATVSPTRQTVSHPEELRQVPVNGGQCVPTQSTPQPHPSFSALPQTWGEAPLPLVHPSQLLPHAQWDYRHESPHAAQRHRVNLPLHHPHPQQQQQYQPHASQAGMPDLTPNPTRENQGELSQAEIWARLQTFYEPTLAFWQGGFEFAAQIGAGAQGQAQGQAPHLGPF